MSKSVRSPVKYPSSCRTISVNCAPSRRQPGPIAGAFRGPGMGSEVRGIPSPTSSRSPSGLVIVVYAVMPQLCGAGGAKAGGIRTSRCEWEVHRDVQAAVRAGVNGQGGAVGVGDRGDDGQTEAVALGLVGAVGAEALERLEQAVDVGRGDRGAGVADREAAGRGGGDLDGSARDVVAYGVGDQVRDQARGQRRVAGDGGRGERGVQPDAVVLLVEHDLAGEVGQVELFPAVDPL